MEKIFLLFTNTFTALVKNFWFWFLCGAIAISNGSSQEKITTIVVLVIAFPLIVTIMNLLIKKNRR